MKLRLLLLSLLLAACAASLRAQTDPLLSQHYAVPTFYNPSFAGSDDLLRIRAAGRLQWVGVDHAPTTFLATADMPLTLFGKRFGVGAVVMQESMGLYSTLQMGAQAAFRFRKFGGEFSVGVRLGMFDEGFRGSEVYLPDDDDFHEGVDDGLPTTDVHGTAFDLGAGISFTHKYFTVGIGCAHLISAVINLCTATSGSSGSLSRAGENASGEKVFEYEA
ncbi:MAG: PorP/SprF family type IX secretion system membrane protein, partial [Muribaculaceae bacterium]|nr:PorP/SprF family type IX secretion system membrane protein [Muribaculaceae bacterium]